MLFEKSEIIGSEKPVVFEKGESQFTYDELINIGENPEEYNFIGFSPVYLNDTQLFVKLYQKGE
ncbi:hypothetical protein ABE151_17655 [Bacillus paralicheniformis]|jgi:hypothetical protein|uniref:hypothetical protein n=1 Tax=Bacillus paralicheniformis TaxID=1648923 RepID=UPI003D253D75